jgi:glycolate oxidase
MKDRTNQAYKTDASQIEGKPGTVVVPKSITEAVSIVRLSQKIIPRGAGSGLAGGCVPLAEQEVILDLSKLNHIIKFDKQRKVVEVEAGIVLDELQEFLKEHDLEFPLNPSSHEICTIGGMIATNAVGSRASKYGRTSNWVNWIEIIDSKGRLQRKTRTELSDYSGMEGITGVIVKAELKLDDRKDRTASLIDFDKILDVVEFARELKREPDISMIEFFDKIVSETLGLNKKYYLLIEYESDRGKLKGGKYKEIMDLRDNLYPLLAKNYYSRIEDPKILLDRLKKILAWTEENNIPVFGHLGVGILHPCFKKEQEKLIPKLMEVVKKLSGQITGEHGIGILKKEFLDANDKKIYLAVKKRTDSQNKFNSGKVI